MKPLGPPDSHHLEAALGWVELGSHLEANEELERIAPQNQASYRTSASAREVFMNLPWLILSLFGNFLTRLGL